MERELPQLESPRTTLRLAQQGNVPAIVRYYTENKVHLATFEPLRSSDFFTESYWCKVNERVDGFVSLTNPNWKSA